MSNKAPAFQFYPEKWLAGTMHLGAVAYRAYHRCLCWMWANSPDGCSIPNDELAIRQATGLSHRSYASAWLGEVMNKHNRLLKKRGKRLISNGLRKEATKQKQRRQQAKAAADARWSACGRIPGAMPKASPLTTTTITTPTLATAQSRARADKRAPTAAEIEAFEAAFGSGQLYALAPLAEEYDEAWVLKALAETRMRGKKSAKYTQGILRRWAQEGGPLAASQGQHHETNPLWRDEKAGL